MTREEAVKILEEYTCSTGAVDGDTCIVVFDAGLDDTETALSMAIAALRDVDALLDEIKDMCFLCRHWNSGTGHEECKDCGDAENFEWRGANRGGDKNDT